MVVLITQQRLSLSIAPGISPGKGVSSDSLRRSTACDARSFSCLPHGTLAVANWANHSLTVFGSLDFQTCRLTDSPKSAGREAALEVGLETWAATVRRRDLTHNFSLSLVASCHR